MTQLALDISICKGDLTKEQATGTYTERKLTSMITWVYILRLYIIKRLLAKQICYPTPVGYNTRTQSAQVDEMCPPPAGAHA